MDEQHLERVGETFISALLFLNKASSYQTSDEDEDSSTPTTQPSDSSSDDN